MHATKRRSVSAKTVDKWILEYNRTLNTSTWLEYVKVAAEYHMVVPSWKVCVLIEDKLKGMRNFCWAYIEGSTNLRTSSFIDHAKTDMHQRAILLLKKEPQQTSVRMPPIAKSLFSLDVAAKTVIKRS